MKLNSSYSRIARSSCLSTPAPASRLISQDTLRRWKKSARESTCKCNQALGFSRCLSKVQHSMQTQLRVIQAEQFKGESSEKTSTAKDEIHLLQDQILSKAEKDIAEHENKGHSSHSFSSHKKDCYHPYQRPVKSREQKSGKPTWKAIGSYSQKRKEKSSQYSSRPAKCQSSYK